MPASAPTPSYASGPSSNQNSNQPLSSVCQRLGKFKVLIVAVLVLVLGLVGYNLLSKPALVTVSGTGRVSAQPEIARFTVVLSDSAATAAEVMQKGNVLTRNAIDLAKTYGVDEKRVQTTSLQVVPPTPGVSADYQAVAGVEVSIKDLDRLDELITRYFEIGAKSVGNIVFTTENSEELEKEAVDMAIKNAKSRAKEIAKSAGKRLGKLRSVTTVESGEAGALTQKGTGTADNTSEIEVVRQASLVYELK